MPPTVIGPYTLDRLLGSGGMADVWLGARADGTRAAVKRLRHVTPALRARFDREAQVLGAIDHPGVVRLLDFGEADGGPWMATTFIDGPDLRQFAERLRGRPPAERAARARAIALSLCDTLGWLHQAGWLHRDVKPSNVLLGEGGLPVLIDFGVVARLDGRPPDELALDPPTATGVLVGSAAWAAPEQLRGERVDARTDQYGLGGTLYFLLTGQRPFSGENTASLVRAHLQEPAPAPSLLDPTIPADLELFLLRLLSKDPGERFPSMKAAAAALAHDEPADAPLAGRQPAIDLIAAALRDVAEGRPVVVQVLGPRGSGRAWVARMARDVADRRGLVCAIADDERGLAVALTRVASGEALLVVTPRNAPDARPLTLTTLALADIRRSLYAFAPRTDELAVVAERLHRDSGGNAGLFLRLLQRYRTGEAVHLPAGPLEVPVADWLDGMDLDEESVAGALAILTAPASEDALTAIAQVPAEAALPSLAERGIAIWSEAGWRLAAEAFRMPLQDLIPDPDALRARADAVLPAAPDSALLDRVAAAGAAADEALENGRIPATLAALDEASEATLPFPHWHAEVSLRRARVQLHLGQLHAALEGARRAVVLVEGSFDPHRRCTVLLGAAGIHLALGLYPDASALAADAAALARASGLGGDRFDAAVLRARVVLEERPHHRTAAAAALDRVINLGAETASQPLSSQVALRAVGAHIAAVLGDRGRLQRLTVEVDGQLAGVPRLDRLTTQIIMGRAMFAGGQAGEARTRADLVFREARQLDLPFLIWQARRLEARACGEPMPSAGPLADGLAERERNALEGT